MLGKPESILQTYFGYPSFRPGQKKVIDLVLEMNNTLAIMLPVVENPYATKSLDSLWKEPQLLSLH